MELVGCPPTSSFSQPSASLASPHSSSSNLLVAAGLISPDLADILATPPDNTAVSKQRVKRIVGAWDLTSNEYVEMFRRDKKRRKILKKKRRRGRKQENVKRKRWKRK